MQELRQIKFGPYQFQSHLANGGMEIDEMIAYCSEPTLPIPKVTLVKIGDQRRQLQKASPTRRRRLAQGLVVLAATSTLLMLPLLTVAGKSALQTLQAQLLPKGLHTQIAHNLKSPTPMHTLTHPTTPTLRMIAPVQANKGPADNNSSVQSYGDDNDGYISDDGDGDGDNNDEDNEKKGDHKHGHGH